MVADCEHCPVPQTIATKTGFLSAPRETSVNRTKTMPQSYFVSPEVFAAEQKRIFARNWLLVGPESRIANSGDYMVIEAAGESLIVIRNSRLEIRAFYNVCRHRGTRLKEDRCGHISAIQCPYHAWTYSLDGRLIGAPHMDEVPGFDKADYSLRPVNLGIWEGFIFVNLADEGAAANDSGYKSLEEWFAPLNEKFSHWNISTLQLAKR